MAVKGGQRFIARNRPPRVQIAYKDPHDEEKLVELPFVMGIMADLSGNDPGEEKLPMDDRKFHPIDMDNFQARMAAIKPGASFRVANKLSDEPNSQLPVKLRFNDMSAFEPPQIARQVPALRKLFEARQQLDNLRRYMDGRVDAEQRLKELLEDPSLMQALRDRAGPRPGGDAEAGAGEEENQTA
jgi:type VI secretion system protein ImpB